MKRFNATSVAEKATLSTLLTSVLFLLLSAFTTSTTASAAELITNGGFEYPAVERWMTFYGENQPLSAADDCPAGNAPDEDAPWACNDDIRVPGWSVFWTDDIASGKQFNPGRLEIQYGDIAGAPAFKGLQKAELDSHHRVGNDNTNVTVAQFVPTCPLTDYTLSYAWKSRTKKPGDNTVHVYIDDVERITHMENLDWQVETLSFTSNNSGQTLILFGSIGDETTKGMFLDDVSVTSVGGDLENCSPICGNKPKKLTLRYDGDDDSDHNQSGNEVTITTPTADFPEMATIKVYGHKWKRPQYLGSFDRRIGEFLTVSGPRNRIPPRLTFEIYDYLPEKGDLPIQTVTFHTSCSQDLDAGDEFGAITVWSAVN
jgi:hypothetical protein